MQSLLISISGNMLSRNTESVLLVRKMPMTTGADSAAEPSMWQGLLEQCLHDVITIRTGNSMCLLKIYACYKGVLISNSVYRMSRYYI